MNEHALLAYYTAVNLRKDTQQKITQYSRKPWDMKHEAGFTMEAKLTPNLTIQGFYERPEEYFAIFCRQESENVQRIAHRSTLRTPCVVMPGHEAQSSQAMLTFDTDHNLIQVEAMYYSGPHNIASRRIGAFSLLATDGTFLQHSATGAPVQETDHILIAHALRQAEETLRYVAL